MPEHTHTHTKKKNEIGTPRTPAKEKMPAVKNKGKHTKHTQTKKIIKSTTTNRNQSTPQNRTLTN